MAVVTEIDGEVCVSVSMCLKRQCGKKQMFVSDQLKEIDEGVLASNYIIQGVARARAWVKMLDDGVAGNLCDLARQLGVDRGFVSKCIRLATISPRIIQAVIDGSAPSGLSVNMLYTIRSEDWDEQEREIGFRAPG